MSLQEKLIFTSTQYDPDQGYKLVERKNGELCAEFKLAKAHVETYEGDTVSTTTTVTLAEDELKNRINFFLKKQNSGEQTPHFEIDVLRKLKAAKEARQAPVPA